MRGNLVWRLELDPSTVALRFDERNANAQQGQRTIENWACILKTMQWRLIGALKELEDAISLLALLCTHQSPCRRVAALDTKLSRQSRWFANGKTKRKEYNRRDIINTVGLAYVSSNAHPNNTQSAGSPLPARHASVAGGRVCVIYEYSSLTS